jgi:hypothetical protein
MSLRIALDPPYIPEQELVMPLPSRMPSMRTPMRFGDPEGDDVFIPPRMGHVPYGPPPGSRYAVSPPQMGYPGYTTRLGSQNHPLLSQLAPAQGCLARCQS